MMMEKYKVCPVCGVHNNPLFLECVECEADLQNIPVVDEEMEQATEQSNNRTADANPTAPMIRLCDCGAKNPVQARRCAVCGEDISMIIPTEDCIPAVTSYQLASLDGAFVYEIREGTVMIGREHDMKEYLASKAYVSRMHAEVILDTSAGVLTVRNYNSMNCTFVNNKMLSGNMSAQLKDGDEVGLGGNEQNGSRQEMAAYFIVRIGACM